MTIIAVQNAIQEGVIIILTMVVCFVMTVAM